MTNSNSNSASDFLAHYGVLGMHWGHRKSTSTAVTKTPRETRPTHPDAQRVRDIATQKKEHGIHTVSNEDLQAFINRKNLEKQYASLKSTQLTGGKKFALELIQNTGKDLARENAKLYARKGVEVAIKTALKR